MTIKMSDVFDLPLDADDLLYLGTLGKQQFAAADAINSYDRLVEENEKLKSALSEMISIVDIHQKATCNNFARFELEYAKEILGGNNE